MQTKNRFPWYSPRFWHGMPSRVWWPLLAKNRWKVDWRRLDFVASVSACTIFTDLVAALQHVGYARAVEKTKLSGPPIFVLGHWRSGTTLLHELLHLDPRYSSPNTYQCFAPWHFLLTERIIGRFGSFLIPDKRPMDNMKAGWKLPQEDEFALMALGAETTYTRIAFPNQPISVDSLSSDTFSPARVAHWKQSLEWFIKAVTYRERKPLILKSPPHTGRLKMIADLFPDAKFVHIARDPMSMIPSTIRLWKSLNQVQGLQFDVDDNALEDFVFDCFNRMYEGYGNAKASCEPRRLAEITYEQLISDPLPTLEQIYEQLELGEFEQVKDAMATRMQSDRDYQVNQWNIPNDLMQRIAERCSSYAQTFGYQLT